MDRSVPADQFKGQVLPTSSPVHRAVEHLASLSPSLYLLVLLRQPFVFLSCKYEPFTLASSRHRLHALGHDVIGLPQRGNSITVSSFRPNGINGSFVEVTSSTKLVSRLLYRRHKRKYVARVLLRHHTYLGLERRFTHETAQDCICATTRNVCVKTVARHNARRIIRYKTLSSCAEEPIIKLLFTSRQQQHLTGRIGR